MDERRLHTSAWNQAVVRLRQAAAMPLGSEPVLEAWLAEHWPSFSAAVAQAYQELVWEEKLPLRYLNYFLSCVLTHHPGGTLPHSLPPERFRLAAVPSGPEIRQGDFYTADGYYRVQYVPQVEPVPPYRWVGLQPPRGFSVCWPNTLYLEVDHDALTRGSHQVKQQLGETVTWCLREGFALREGDRWRDGWLLCGPGLAGRLVHEVHGLPPEAVVAGVAPIPVVILGGHTAELHLRGGALMDPWRQPRVERDPSISREDNALADRCEKVIRLLAGNRQLSGWLGGRPPQTPPAPGTSYPAYVREQYRQALAELRNRPSDPKKSKLRKRVLKRGERLFAPGQRPSLPVGWYAAVESEEPWRQGGTAKAGAQRYWQAKLKSHKISPEQSAAVQAAIDRLWESGVREPTALQLQAGQAAGIAPAIYADLGEDEPV